MTNLTHTINLKLKLCWTERISLQEFDVWFAPIIWKIEKYKDQQAQELAYSVEVILAEFSSGFMKKIDVLEKFQKLTGD